MLKPGALLCGKVSDITACQYLYTSNMLGRVCLHVHSQAGCNSAIEYLVHVPDSLKVCGCVQARQALTGALKIWWDQSHSSAPDWHPALLPSIFLGAKAAAMNSNIDPNQVGYPSGVLLSIGLWRRAQFQILHAGAVSSILV